MTRLQKTEWQFKGEITAFLSLLFILILSLVGVLVESASIQITRSRKRADVNTALESVFAEYHTEMLHIYDVFVRFGCEEDRMQDRLEYYGAGNMSHSLAKVRLLTDDSGNPYYNQVVRYMKSQLGIHTDSSKVVEEEELFFYETERDEVFADLDGLLAEEETGLTKENNPMNWARNLKSTGLLSLLVPNSKTLSNSTIAVETLPTHRTLQKGTDTQKEQNATGGKWLFVRYLKEHFANYTTKETSKPLLYEQEYLLAGEDGDRENLEAVCKKILNMRMALNYAYLLSDTQRQAEAEAMALSLCAMVLNPEIAPLVKQALLLVWAYGESIVDVRGLLKEKKVPVIKTSETWQLQLANVTKLGTNEEISGEKDYEQGITYEDYLESLLLLENKEDLCMRSLDLIEANLHIKTDHCMTKASIETKLLLRRGVRDTFITTFEYQ